jgi:ABC-type sugar transport system substrate-binding protein
MRRHRMALLVVLSLLGLSLGALAAGCGGGNNSSGGGQSKQVANVPFTGSPELKVPEGYPQPKHQKLRLGFLNPLKANEFLNTMGESMRLETQRLGGTLTELDAKGDVDTQVSQFSQLLAQKPDGIAVFALDPGSVAPVVKRAKAAGIPLVTIDLSNTNPTAIDGYDTQVWERRDQAAYMSARQMTSKVGKGADVATIDFAVKVPSIVFSVSRYRYWAKKFGLKVVGNASNPSDDIAGGEKAMTQILGKFSGVKGVLAYNDPSAIGAASAARSQGKRDLVFGGENGGSDALEAIKAGRLSYTIKLDPPSMGKDFADALYDLKQGKKVPKTVKAGPPQLVTSDNIDKVQNWAQELKKEYGKQ